MMTRFQRLYWWLRHLGHTHYAVDLGRVVGFHQLPDGRKAYIRKCYRCDRRLIDFASVEICNSGVYIQEPLSYNMDAKGWE